MTEELYRLLHRQISAVEALEARLRALELVVAADERRFVAIAMDELDTATEALSALELTRTIALNAAGFSPDLSADELVAAIDAPGDRELLAGAIERLRVAVDRLEETRERVRTVVGRNAIELRNRIEAAERLAAV